MCDFYTPSRDVDVILKLVQKQRPRHIVEFGVCQGATAARILREIDFVEKYTGVDVPAEFQPFIPGQKREIPKVGKAGFMAAQDPRFDLFLLEKGTQQLICQPDLIDLADMVYIDADHSYEGVKRDTLLAERLLKNDTGLIVWHDYGNPTVEVTKFIDELNKKLDGSISFVEDSWICYLNV